MKFWNTIENIALRIVLREVNLLGASEAAKIKQEDRDRIFGELWKNKELLTLLKDIAANDIHFQLLHTDPEKRLIQLGELKRTFRLIALIRLSYKKWVKTEIVKASKQNKAEKRDAESL